MPRGRVVYVPASAPGRLSFQGLEIPVRAEDVADDARRPGTRVRFDLAWEDGEIRPRNVHRTRGARAGRAVRGGSER